MNVVQFVMFALIYYKIKGFEIFCYLSIFNCNNPNIFHRRNYLVRFGLPIFGILNYDGKYFIWYQNYNQLLSAEWE